MNSIDSARNRDDLINEILLTLNESPETVALLVEGSDDVEFFQTVFEDFSHIAYFESLSGCEELVELLSEPDLQSGRVVAVRDRDYTDPAKYPYRLFAYDDCAMELMILHNPDIQKVLKRCYTRNKNGFPLDMMRTIASFSVLRKKNASDKKLEIAFQKRDKNGKGGISILVGANPVPDINRVFQLYEAHYPDKMSGQYALCQAEADALSDDDLWYITNGHDICRVLGNVSQLNPSKSLGENAYRRLMIVTYDFQYFQGTDLYRKLSEYRLSDGRRPFAAS